MTKDANHFSSPRKTTLIEIPKEHRVLDNLSRILEKSSQGCAALCFINGQLLIADNDIDYKTNLDKTTNNRGNISTYGYIKQIMDYYKAFALYNNLTESKKKDKELKKIDKEKRKILLSVCDNRIKTEGKGDIRLKDEERIEIANFVINNKDWRKQYEAVLRKYPAEKRKYIAHAAEVAALVVRDWKKVEQLSIPIIN